jgi:hypothetical protein
MIASIGAMIARRAPEADRTAAAGLITQSTPSMLLALVITVITLQVLMFETNVQSWSKNATFCGT